MADNTEKLVTLSNLSDHIEEIKRILKQVRAYIDKQDSAKVDKVSGKGLSTNDLTTELLNKLNSLENYDDTAVRNLIMGISSRIDTLVGESATEAIDNFNEILAFLNGITDTQTIQGLLSNLKTEIDGLLANKVDKVSGKQLSTNDYTTAEKTKLSGIEEGAQVNTITGIKGNAESSYRTGNVNLTPANIGAAAASHTHNASEITSGTLPADRIADKSITKEKLADGIFTDNILISTIYIDQTITDPASMIYGDINGVAIQAIRANSHRFLGKYTANGTMTICQLSDTDSTKFADGSAADLTGAQGDVFMCLPVFYTQAIELVEDRWQIKFAFGGQPGPTWKKWGGNDLIGVYKAYSLANKIYSRSDVTPSTNISQANFKAYARNRGTGFTLVKHQHQNIMAFLFYALYGNTNSQEICGYGTNTYPKTTGGTNSLGMTDTTSTNGNSMSINFWGLENWWGDLSEKVDNVICNSNTWNITEDDGTTRQVAGFVGSGSYYYPTKLVIGDYLDTIMTPDSASRGDSEGYCDAQFLNNGNSLVVSRSFVGSYSNGGLVCVYQGVSSEGGTNDGSRLAFTGNVIEEKNTETFKSLTAIG